MATATSVQPPKLTAADKDRIQAIRAAQAAYRGEFDPPLMKEDSPIAWVRDERTPDFNVLVNRCGPVVDVAGEFLFGEELAIEVDAEAGANAQIWLDQCWGDVDDRMTLFGEIHQNGAIAGHAFVKVLPPDDPQDGPEFVVLDPEYLSVLTDPHNQRKALGYRIEYSMVDDNNVPITYCQYISRQSTSVEQWTIQDFVAKGGAGASYDLIDEQEWPYPFCPIVDCQNLTETRDYWGRSDLTPDVIGINKAIILNASNINKIGWHYAFPWVYGSGFMGDIDPTPGKAIKFPSPESKLAAVQFTNDLPALMNFLANLRGDMDEQTGVPSVATGRVSELPKGQISGVAIEQLYQRLLSKIKKKRRLYGRLIRKLCQIILFFGGHDPDADSVKVHLHWPDMLPVDDFMAWQSAILQDQLEVSRHTIFGNFGMDYDHEAELRKQEAPEPAPMPPGGAPGQPPTTPGQDNQQNDQNDQNQPPPQLPPEVVAMQQAMKAHAAAQKTGG